MKKGFLVAMLYSVFMPVMVFAQPSSGSCSRISSDGLSGLVDCVISFFDIAIYLMVAASVVVIVWGAFKMIYSEEGRVAGRETVIYGIIGLFVMVSIWGFVNILDRTFKLSGEAPIQPPILRVMPSSGGGSSGTEFMGGFSNSIDED